MDFFNAEDVNSKITAVAKISGALADGFGRQSDAGKAFAVAQTTIETYLAAQLAYKSQFFPIADVSSPIRGKIAAVAAIAGGLLRVQKILSVKKPKFAKGTLYADEGEAIVDEQGAELHFDKNWNLKDKGQSGGARTKYLKEGDKIIPSQISKYLIESTIGNKQTEREEKIDYNKFGSAVASAIGGGAKTQYIVLNNKIIKVEETKNNTNFIYQNNTRYNQNLI
jgi:hypothetical protein